jgi:hypothetical protein
MSQRALLLVNRHARQGKDSVAEAIEPIANTRLGVDRGALQKTLNICLT